MKDKELKEIVAEYPQEINCHPRASFEEQLFGFLKARLKRLGER